MLRRSSTSTVAVAEQPVKIAIPQQASESAPAAAPTAEIVSLQAELAIQQALALIKEGARVRWLCRGGMDQTAMLRALAGTTELATINLGIDLPNSGHRVMSVQMYVTVTGCSCSDFTVVFSSRSHGRGAHITAEFCDHNVVRKAHLAPAPLAG
jgi:hypothetical protein